MLSSVPTVSGISSIVPIYHGIGGDPLVMGILRPWAKTKMGPEKLFEAPSLMQSFTQSKGIAWPLVPDALRNRHMLSKLNLVAILAISFHKILCYYFPGNFTLPDCLKHNYEIADATSL
ncbi:MAG TPA: hypothetical protein VE843_00230 [Ktedonobacteraceae bacterium]|nr:hypothetical protein [Ktedonobacteraceae bacterium]